MPGSTQGEYDIVINSSQMKRFAATILPTPAVVALRYPRESLYVRGWARVDESQPSVLFFTMHKCASTLMRRLLAHLNKRALGLTHLNMAAYCWNGSGNEPVSTHLNRESRRYFQDRGILYAPLRDYIDVSHLQDARILAMLRDPRDILVSAFYSTAYIHRPPVHPRRRKAMLDHREHVRHIGLEGHVRQRAPILAARLETYRRHIPRERVVTYEHMWRDFRGFIQRLAGIVDVELDATLTQELEAIADVGGQANNGDNPIRRKGTPGEHREKLSPAMVDELNDMFADTLAWLYPESGEPGKKP